MYRIIHLLVHRLDRYLETAGTGMGLFFHPEWRHGYLQAWHDENGTFTLEVWRFEFVVDEGLRWIVNR